MKTNDADTLLRKLPLDSLQEAIALLATLGILAGLLSVVTALLSSAFRSTALWRTGSAARAFLCGVAARASKLGRLPSRIVT